MQVGGHSQGNAVARLNSEEQTWESDPTQPKNAYNSLFHDTHGNPGFIVKKNIAWIKANG